MAADTGTRKRSSGITSHRWFTPWLLLAPAVIWVLVFALWPFLNTVVLSFTDAKPLRTPEFVGGANYERMFGDEMFWNALTTCIIYVVVCVPLLTILLPSPERFYVTGVAVAVALAATGYVSAKLGYARPLPAVIRNVLGGVFAMVVTLAIGSLLGTRVG